MSVASPKIMGGSQSTSVSPLDCLMKNFSDFSERADDYGVSVDAFTLRRLCELEWPNFRVNWPSTGTFDLGPCQGVRRVVYGKPGHPDQIPLSIFRLTLSLISRNIFGLDKVASHKNQADTARF